MDTINHSQPLMYALEHVSRAFDRRITLKELREPGKKQSQTRPRFYVMAYIRAFGEVTGDVFHSSYPYIARRLGLGDHTSVLHGERRAHEIWGRDHFDALALEDFGPVISVTYNQMMETGRENMSRFVNGEGWA